MDKQTKSTNWSVTINNPTQNDEEYLALARQKGWKVEGQLEKGDNGTPHYQLLVTCKGQQRFTAIKKAFPRAHIEPARDVVALKKYVNKEETRVGQLPTQNEQYPSCSKLMAWYGEYYDTQRKLVGHECFDRLDVFDQMICSKIRQGYYVESMGVNPQIRSSIKNYGKAIADRERLHRQKTDRQTSQDIISESGINQYESQIQENCDEEISQTQNLETQTECASCSSSTSGSESGGFKTSRD